MKESQIENKAKVQQPQINPDGSLSPDLCNPMYEGLPKHSKLPEHKAIVDPNVPENPHPHVPDMPDVVE